MENVFRARSSIARMQYSATDCALPPGMFDTGTPRAVASASGTRSVPVPWIATARTRGAEEKRSSGSLLRVITPSVSRASNRIVSWLLSGERTTSAARERSASPSAAIGSTIRTRCMSPRVPGEDFLRALERVEVGTQRRHRLRGDGLGRPAFGAVHRAHRPVLRYQEKLVRPHAEDLAGDVPGLIGGEVDGERSDLRRVHE